jgi:nicotinate-nucleotide pyrophosphorylase (carboxylating)
VIATLPDLLVEPIVRRALEEDLGRAGDVTSQAVIPQNASASAAFVARESGVIAGVQPARLAFTLIDSGLDFQTKLSDGTRVSRGDTIATVSGNARSLLAGERVALNFLCHLSGVATLTAKFVAAAGGRAKIACTRKTTPGLRLLEKAAVRAGGGSNHRYGLDDAILIKDNHIAVAGSVADALHRARTFAGHMTAIEIEVDTLKQLEEALDEGAMIVLIDNFSLEDLKTAVRINRGRAVLEASGGVTLDSVGAIAATGVDFISAGAITHSAPTLDIGLDINGL